MSPGGSARALAGTGALLLGALPALSTSCATAGGGAAGDPREGAVSVEVTNNATERLVVYAIYGGQRTRVGDVTALGSATFRLPPSLEGGAARVRFVLDAIGSTDGYRSEELFLSPGDAVIIRVQPNLRQTTVFVR